MCLTTTVYGESSTEDEQDKNKQNKPVIKTDLQDKYYRQALYYYFQGYPAQALTQVEQSKAKLTQLDSRSALFEAGLQLSAGLLQPAKETLINFETFLEQERIAAEKANLEDDNDEHTEKHQKRAVKAKELRLIALLSLTDQYLAQGDISQAKDTLTKITTVPAVYYPEYYVLNQLAYWPEKNKNLLAKPEDSTNENSPYIQLNEALRLIELAQADATHYDLAISALQQIKVTPWHEEESSFWKTLFIDDAKLTSPAEKLQIAKLQSQAIQDYAKLLLAQIYISQQQYDLAFVELKTFPGESPYQESALFLFAFASQQVKQYTISLNLLNLLIKDYPYSPLSWQSAELMAAQVSEQQSLAQGVSAYQSVESFFVQRQQDLSDFSREFNQSHNLLTFSVSQLSNLQLSNEVLLEPAMQHPPNQEVINIGDRVDVVNTVEYFPKSVWLQQALADVELANLYQSLIDIDQQTANLQLLKDKTAWLAQIITLNQQRKAKIVTSKKLREEQGTFALLNNERDRLAAIHAQQLANEDKAAFANEVEREWLSRIENSYKALNAIGSQKNTEEYKERLARVEGVLAWQLAQQFPQRSWAQTKQLQQLNKAIDEATAKQKNIERISNTQDAIDLSINKHNQSETQLISLLSQLAQLREQISIKIKAKVNAYIEEQNVTLAEHVLTTRQSMANVLERMAVADKRLSSQLITSPEKTSAEKDFSQPPSTMKETD
ncbi:hypothetical protein [Colwellia echini]|nr:hypothetical protein [Colwellia echini]